MDLLDVMNRVVTIEEGLAISAPIETGIKRVYRYFPPSSKAVTDTPCFLNQWSAPTLSFHSALMIGDFTLHMQLLISDVDEDKAADIATAFYPKIVTAFATNLKLDGSSPVWVKQLRGGEPTLAGLTFAGIDYVGLDLYLDFGISRGQVMEV